MSGMSSPCASYGLQSDFKLTVLSVVIPVVIAMHFSLCFSKETRHTVLLIHSLHTSIEFSDDVRITGLKDGGSFSCAPVSFMKIGITVKRAPWSCPGRGTGASAVCEEGLLTAGWICWNS